MADRVAERRAHGQLYLRLLVTDGAGQAGVQGALPVRVRIVHALLAHGVVVVSAVREHALALRAHGAQLALARDGVEEVVVVADADGVVGVGAGLLHPHEAGALGAGLALLGHAVVLGEGLACGGETTGVRRRRGEINRRLRRRSDDINHVYCTFIRREDTLIHWAGWDLCTGTREVLFFIGGRV